MGSPEVVCETERLRVRQWTPDDAEAAFAIYGDPEVWRFLGGAADADVKQTRAGLRWVAGEYARTPGFGLWAAVEQETGEVVGAVALRLLDGGPDVEVAYHIARRHWGRGFATEAACGAIRYGFEVLELPRVVAVVNPANIASRRVLDKCGLVYQRRGEWYGMELDLLEIASGSWPAGTDR
jgi:ribosomal-protein-alanine N-acetyltransferase